jgi:hypothetical protein
MGKNLQTSAEWLKKKTFHSLFTRIIYAISLSWFESIVSESTGFMYFFRRRRADTDALHIFGGRKTPPTILTTKHHTDVMSIIEYH